MTNAKQFSKLDTNHGYWQIPLDEDSQLTIFDTPFGIGIATYATHLVSPQRNKFLKKERVNTSMISKEFRRILMIFLFTGQPNES